MKTALSILGWTVGGFVARYLVGLEQNRREREFVSAYLESVAKAGMMLR